MNQNANFICSDSVYSLYLLGVGSYLLVVTNEDEMLAGFAQCSDGVGL